MIFALILWWLVFSLFLDTFWYEICKVCCESTSTTHLVNCIPESVKKKTKDKPPEDQGKDHVMTTIYSSHEIWILDSGDSNYMVSSKHYFSSPVPCTRPPMLMGDKTPRRVCEEGSVELDYGIF